MNNSAALVKCRHLLGRLGSFGIEGSRVTGPPHNKSNGAEATPEAFLVSRDGRAWLVTVWGGRSLQTSLGLELEGDCGDVMPLEAIAEGLLAWRGRQQSSSQESPPALLVLAPLLDQAEVPSREWSAGGEQIAVLGRQACKGGEMLSDALLSRLAPVLSATAIAHWRARAIPEVCIQQVRSKPAVLHETEALAAPLLLDYKQERCARLDLEPDPEGKLLVRDLHLRLVTGVAGCGKTLVLVHRAALLATHFPSARVLIVSHNRPLITDMRRRLDRLGASGSIKCLTFYQWLSRLAPAEGEMMFPREVRQWVERERQRQTMSATARFSDEWIADEMSWIFDHALADDSYLTVERKGRGTRLSKNQRRQILDLLLRYRAHLSATGRGDWAEWPLAVKERRSWAVERERFDHILIDEAQFFAPVWLELLRRALKRGGHFFLCADPTQGFLRRRLSWSDMGLDMRNRSSRLERPYRSTRAILEFARAFYQRRLPDDDEPLNLPAAEWMEALEPGVVPLVQAAGPRQDQLARLVNELHSLRKNGCPLENVMILVAGREFPERLITDTLNKKLGEGTAALIKDSSARCDSAGVAHLMASTGLERPIVILLGVDDLAAEESNPRFETEEQAEKIRDNTRQIYVGLTRAMERLVIYTSNPAMRYALGVFEPTTAATSRVRPG